MIINRYVPNLNKGKGLYFYFIKAETKTKSGLVARPVLTSYYKSEQFRNRPRPLNVMIQLLKCSIFHHPHLEWSY